jgi:L-rhamnose mutarotase
MISFDRSIGQKARNRMKRIGFLLKVRPEKMEEYKTRHKEVWPEMLDALRRTGWHNYSLFMRDDGMLFGYFEANESLQASQAGMSKEEINAVWQDSMAPFFENLEGLHADEGMLELEEVFHTD